MTGCFRPPRPPSTSTVPARSTGLVATICVAESLVIVAAVLPKSTAVAFARFVPVIVTEVPPVVGPEAGMMPDTAGGAAVIEGGRGSTGESAVRGNQGIAIAQRVDVQAGEGGDAIDRCHGQGTLQEPPEGLLPMPSVTSLLSLVTIAQGVFNVNGDRGRWLRRGRRSAPGQRHKMLGPANCGMSKLPTGLPRPVARS